MLSLFNHVQLFATLWMEACQAPRSMRFSRQEYWGGLPCPPPGDLPDPGIKPASLMSPALAGGFHHYTPIKKKEEERCQDKDYTYMETISILMDCVSIYTSITRTNC